jgi:hypothetical protein
MEVDVFQVTKIFIYGFESFAISLLFSFARHCSQHIRSLASNGEAALPLLCSMKKKYYISQRKSGSDLSALQDLRSILRISLPPFPFEFSVEQASNRMIDLWSNKGFKAASTFIYSFTFQ